MSKAFDYVSHAYMTSALRRLNIPEDDIQLILALRDARYHLEHKGHHGTISLSYGVRQGCVLSPLLWVCVTHYMLRCLEETLSHFQSTAKAKGWIYSQVAAFADDFLATFRLSTVEDLNTMCTQIGRLFTALSEAGMQLNPEKSQLLTQAAGPTLRKWISRRARRVEGAKFVQLGTPFVPCKSELSPVWST